MSSTQIFQDVRFVLLGFDPVKQQKVRSDLISGGGVEIGRYCKDSSHIIVDKLIYDDPVCDAARKDGKIVVTGLWVEHSSEAGAPLDISSIMYRPVRDLNGIPGAKSLIMCLTGYQKPFRDDVMTMVGLMGAQFSKPLLANKVTHLICYKFEGEKYELAKRMNIKLVNHRWLEDCLNAWELLPEDSYKKSGYDLEMEAEAKDSEEELEDINEKQFKGRHINSNPCTIQAGTSRMNMLPGPAEVSKVLQNTRVSKGLIIEKDATYCKSSEKDDDKELPEAFAHHQTIALKGTTFDEPSGVHDRSPISLNVRTGSIVTGGSTKRSSPDAEKLSTINYSRKTLRKATLPLEQGHFSSKASSSCKAQLGGVKFSDAFNASRSNREHAKGNNGSGLLTVGGLLPEDEQSAILAKKRKADVSSSGSKLHKVNSDSKATISGTTSGDAGTERFEATPGNYPLYMKLNLPLKENSRTIAEVTSLDPAQHCLSSTSAVDASCVLRSPLKCGLSRSKSMASEALQDGNEEEQTPKTFQRATAKPDMPSKANAEDVGLGRSVQEVDNICKPQNKRQDVDASLVTKGPDLEKTGSPTLNLSNKRNDDSLSKPQKNRQQDMDASLVTKEPVLQKMCSPTPNLSNKRNDDSLSKPQRKKCAAKKSLGSRPRLSASITNKQKGSILGRTSHDNSASDLIKEKETGENEKLPEAKKLETVPLIAGAGEDKDVESNDISNSKSEQENKTLFMDDDTEAPEDKEEFELEKTVTIGKPEVIKSTNKADAVVQEKSEKGQCMTNKTDTVNLAMPGDAIASGKMSVSVKTAVYDKSPGISKPGCRDMVKGKMKKATVTRTGETKKTISTSTERLESEIPVTEEAVNDKGKEKTHVEQERLTDPDDKVESNAAPPEQPENSEGEKENMPIGEHIQNVSCGKPEKGKMSIKSGAPKKIHQKTGDSMHAKGVLSLVKPEPAWFILSGHRLQKKEFQHVIKRLRGRLCRDSHQWSYQATHFIVPDPIRRTEKFFAAAASGRWILKTDYLTASCQAGKFLAEEPFEWHKNGLSEDGAINLKAPRKWRLLKEKTGHGAFHGLHVIVYGDCIAPPLDTLKRAVKAGDGTILATSPPYTRFLNSGVDFAVVTPGMPRADVWVQEFLSHEIPCIVADYLVEYVCKPGYSLEKHVLYNTHAWAEKSFANLQSRLEEIVGELITHPTEDSGDSELSCQVCGSSDRGEVMLICGGENGNSGCGIGTHIDCCDPPLHSVPEEDWFCSKCSEASSKSQPLRKGTGKKTFKVKSK
ncbi:BRCT domain [Dillenia turbinata]|uniref:BRCT domain n=1 Tax=Dillenia turbinata TaxID=194707 RepID=A0AAN8W6X8_9MAGN